MLIFITIISGKGSRAPFHQASTSKWWNGWKHMVHPDQYRNIRKIVSVLVKIRFMIMKPQKSESAWPINMCIGPIILHLVGLLYSYLSSPFFTKFEIFSNFEDLKLKNYWSYISKILTQHVFGSWRKSLRFWDI